MKKYITLSIVIIAVSLTPVRADVFSDIIDLIIANNPALKSSLASSQAMLDEMRADGNLPDPEVEFSHRWGAENVGNKWDLSVTQSFDWPGVYAARSNAVKSTSSAMEYLQQSAVIDTRMEARLLLIDIINARCNIEVLEKIYDSVTQLSTLYRKAVAQGEVTRLDYNKVEIERISIESELDAARSELDGLTSTLTALNGGKSVDISTLESYPEPDLSVIALGNEDLENYIKTHDPAVTARNHSAEAEKAMATAARRSRLPGFSLGYVHEYEMGDNFNGFSVGISLPFFSARHKEAAAKWAVKSIQWENDGLVADRVAKFKIARSKAIAAKKISDSYSPVVNTDENMRLLRKALDGGQISMLTFIQEENYFREACREYLTALYNYNIAVAELMRYE